LLRRELAVIRKQGYGLDNEEYEMGIRAIASPIRDRNGKVIAAVAMPGPTERMTPDRTLEMAESLMGATKAISQRLGWQP
jgi:DNA-binding IclR family transcriptional regulator